MANAADRGQAIRASRAWKELRESELRAANADRAFYAFDRWRSEFPTTL